MDKDIDSGQCCPACGAPIMVTPTKDEYCKFICGWSLTQEEKISGRSGRPDFVPYANHVKYADVAVA